MTATNTRAQLAEHPFSKDFQPHQLDRLATLARAVNFSQDQIIFRSGEKSSDFYLITDGRLALEMIVGERVLRIQTLSGGEEFGFSSVILGRPMTFQARALEPVAALAFRGSQLLEACQSDPEFGYSLMGRMLLIVSERLDATRLQLMDTYSHEAARAGA